MLKYAIAPIKTLQIRPINTLYFKLDTALKGIKRANHSKKVKVNISAISTLKPVKNAKSSSLIDSVLK
jgi:hypothetical protein